MWYNETKHSLMNLQDYSWIKGINNTRYCNLVKYMQSNLKLCEHNIFGMLKSEQNVTWKRDEKENGYLDPYFTTRIRK